MIDLDADLRSTAANQALAALVDANVPPDERATNIALRNSLSLIRYYNTRPVPETRLSVKAWHTFLELRQWQSAWRRRHKHNPINTPPRAA